MRIATRTFCSSTRRTRCHRTGMPRGGLTLVELVIAITILLVLISAVLVTGRMARDSRKKAQAQQSLASLANAINQYAAFWPAWKMGTIAVAERGWPDYIAGRLFDAPYAVVGGFNDYVNLNTPPPGADNLLNANECLFYCLSAEVGKGPFIKPDSPEDRRYSMSAVGLAMLYPGIGSSGAKPRQQLLDVWGTPYRYFWVYRDVLAFRGYLPVMTADTGDPNFRKAVGFVLESAGPDKQFGNVWQTNALVTPQDKLDAEDNLIISP